MTEFGKILAEAFLVWGVTVVVGVTVVICLGLAAMALIDVIEGYRR